jgi:hypothetical protein
MKSNSDFIFIKEIRTSTVRIRLLKSGIIHYTYLLNSEIDEQGHQINHDALIELVGKNELFPILIDSEGQINITLEGRKKVRELEAIVPLSHRAIVISTLSQRILANFYIKFHKPLVSTKVFDTHIEALAWLNKHQVKIKYEL